MKQLLVLLLALTTLCVTSGASRTTTSDRLRSALASYLRERGSIEHITAASLSVDEGPADAPLSVAAGATPSNLFQIGSNTKAFTAVIVLQLEAAGKLRIDDRIGTWLPQYPAWKNVTIRRMLNMTSGIETYDNTLAMQKAYAAHPYRDFSASDLVAFVYPRDGKAVFARGWHYSNTGYLLAQMIVERITHEKFGDVLRTRIFRPLALGETYYDRHELPRAVQKRIVAGYFANDGPDNRGLRPLYGKNVRDYSLSWTQAAGGIVATPSDVTRWARALYSGKLLPRKQQAELMTLVSDKTGKPIETTSRRNPGGFGLGVAEALKPSLGRVWYYEGMTLGYRVLHVWDPQRNTIVTIGLNSQPRSKDDHIGELTQRVLAILQRTSSTQ